MRPEDPCVTTEVTESPAKKQPEDFSGGPRDKNLPASAGDMGSIPGPGRSHMPRTN